MTKRVAVVGDVTATASPVLSPKATGGSGAWTAGSVSYTSYPKLKAGSAVIWKAQCTFTFAGANSGGTTVNDSETVTLTAATTKLNKGQHSVLVHGYTETGVKGNQLSVSATADLKTG